MIVPNLILTAFAMIPNLATTRLVSLHPDLVLPKSGGSIIKEFQGIQPGFDFTEMIPSWNIANSSGVAMKLEVRAHVAKGMTKWFTMAEWSLDSKRYPRHSIKGQRDEDGTVDTDTLDLKKTATSLDARVTLTTLEENSKAKLKLLTFAFTKAGEDSVPVMLHSSSYGKCIDVPQRAQGNYPNGGVLCSPTSVSMMLWHYSTVLKKPELNKDVPEVENHVWDEVYKGAGNWPFNTAYAGSFDELVSYVTRMDGIGNLEAWIDKGLPVICSVSFDLLRGLPLSPTESGHLVVLVGFTKDGDPIINDPAFKKQVRKVYPRHDFEQGWQYSKRTVYLIYPKGSLLPDDPNRLWTVGL